MDHTPNTTPLDCACVIHGTAYSWDYVDRLYNMLTRHCSRTIRLHVYTEDNRQVPGHMVKHSLTPWEVHRAWWYKVQLFNPEHHAGPLLYFDLDVVIVNNIDWIWKHSAEYFWGIRDFNYLQRPTNFNINSSVMWWNTVNYQYVWDKFDIGVSTLYRGDQDYITHTIPDSARHTFDIDKIKSWRWECYDGGFEFTRKKFKTPGTGTVIPIDTSILVFHGNPKPAQIHDVVIKQHWT